MDTVLQATKPMEAIIHTDITTSNAEEPQLKYRQAP